MDFLNVIIPRLISGKTNNTRIRSLWDFLYTYIQQICNIQNFFIDTHLKENISQMFKIFCMQFPSHVIILKKELNK